MRTRQKRAIPEGWATAENLSAFTALATVTAKAKKASFISIDEAGEEALIGGDKGLASEISIEDGKAVHEFKTEGGTVTNGLYWPKGTVLATSTGKVNVYAGEEKAASFDSHAGAANAVALHPSGEILASVGVDKSYILYDLTDFTVLTQVYTESGQSTDLSE